MRWACFALAGLAGEGEGEDAIFGAGVETCCAGSGAVGGGRPRRLFAEVVVCLGEESRGAPLLGKKCRMVLCWRGARASAGGMCCVWCAWCAWYVRCGKKSPARPTQPRDLNKSSGAPVGKYETGSSRQWGLPACEEGSHHRPGTPHHDGTCSQRGRRRTQAQGPLSKRPCG